MLLLLLVACGATPGEGERPAGVIVVSLDTLRADRLGAYGSARGLTPNLDRFAAEGVVIEEAYAQANETLPSHASLYTSRYPSELGVLDGPFVPRGDAPTLAAAFHAAGWQTAGFVAGGHLARGFGLAAGFTTYDDTAEWGSLRDTAPRALRWLDTNAAAGPFLLVVHGYDTHDRYLKPPPFGYALADAADVGLGAQAGRVPGGSSRVVGGHLASGLTAIEALALSRTRFDRGEGIQAVDPAAQPLGDRDVAHLAALYDGATAWMDACFGLFMAGLDARGLLDDVVVIVLSDHGEELGEHGAFEHRASLTDETLHVPWMVRLPGGAHGGRRVAGLVGLLDVAPTALDLAGVPIPTGARGASLRGALIDGDAVPARDVVFSEGALRLLSARGPRARLTAEGLGAGNPLGPALLEVAPVDGASLHLTGEPTEADALRTALVGWRRAMGAP
ncbi:MAG: sulfatase [Pseudomonadota bacterium]|nr:sulfatase [Pseudomonadota bacterium]